MEGELERVSERLHEAEKQLRHLEAEEAKGGLGEARARANLAEVSICDL